MQNRVVTTGKSKKGREFIIRYPTMDDVQSVCEYINKLSQERTFIRFQGEVISLEDEEKYLKQKLEEIENHKSVVLYLIVDNKVHGVCGIEMLDKTEDHIGWLGLSVDESVRGEGLGRILIEAAMNEASKHLTGIKMIRLEVRHPNIIAIQLYEKLGFIKYGHLPKGARYRGELVDEVLMYKEV